MHIHLDLMGGIAGDMFLAASIDSGIVDIESLQKGLRTLGLGGSIRIVHEKAWRGAMSAIHVKFEGWDPDAESDHRHLSTILEMISQSSFSDQVKSTATQLFRLLGESEAKVHGIPLESVHFHEVGAVDSILDFVSAAWIIHHADATWSIGDIPFGQGVIQTAHGEIPLPAPATADLLRGFRLKQKDIKGELVTPTGAAIIKMVNPNYNPINGVLKSIGYGAGTKDFDGHSNVLRMMIFEEDGKLEIDKDLVIKFDTEIDDMNPEILSSVTKELFASGALDVVQESIHMKKGRLGMRLSVLCHPEEQDRIAKVIFVHTSTFGIRKSQMERLKLKREIEQIETKFGLIHVKVGYWGENVIKRSPEYVDCQRVAEEFDIPLMKVYEEVLSAITPNH